MMQIADRSPRHHVLRRRGGGAVSSCDRLSLRAQGFVLGAQRVQLRLQIVDVGHGHEASSERMSLIVAQMTRAACHPNG